MSNEKYFLSPDKLKAIQAKIQELALLSEIEYILVREREAKNLGIGVGMLDKLVQKACPTVAPETQGHSVLFPAVELWPEAVKGAELLDGIYATIKRFIICDNATARAITLWIAFTWFVDRVQISPMANITAPEKRCGKSLLLALISLLCRRPLIASNISPAAIFRVIEAYGPTLLIDEADSFLKENEEARGILNSGHTRQTAFVVRNVGEDHEPVCFKTFGAKVICGIGKPSDTLMDRSIKAELRRKLPGENVERLRHADPEHFKRLSSMLARYAKDAGKEIENARPALPEDLNDRAQDNWEPLLAIADHAGGDWPEKARRAALKISGDGEVTSLPAQLLTDIREIFTTSFRNEKVVTTRGLLDALNEDDEKLWCAYNRGKPLSPHQLAKKLEGYGIKPSTHRIGKQTSRGYAREDFEDVFARYLTQPEGEE